MKAARLTQAGGCGFESRQVHFSLGKLVKTLAIGLFIFVPIISGIGLAISGIMRMNDAQALVEVGAGFTNANIVANGMWIIGTVCLGGGILISLFWTAIVVGLSRYYGEQGR